MSSNLGCWSVVCVTDLQQSWWQVYTGKFVIVTTSQNNCTFLCFFVMASWLHIFFSLLLQFMFTTLCQQLLTLLIQVVFMTLSRPFVYKLLPVFRTVLEWKLPNFKEILIEDMFPQVLHALCVKSSKPSATLSCITRL